MNFDKQFMLEGIVLIMKRTNITRRILAIMLVMMFTMSICQNVYADWNHEETYEKNLKAYNVNARTEKYLLELCTQPDFCIESDDPKIIDRAKEITAGINSDYDKAKAIHDWVCNNIWYDYDWRDKKTSLYDMAINSDTMDIDTGTSIYDEKSYRRSAIGTLEYGRAVCAGYATLTTALLRAAGIPAQYVGGVAGTDRGLHAWTEAYVNNRWIIIDTTWDSGNKWENGKQTASNGLTGYEYFDISLEDFSKDHEISLGKDGYTPYIGTLVENGQLILCGNVGEDLQGITSIKNGALYGNTLIKDFAVPNGVTVIPFYMFAHCTNLESLVLPDTVRVIEHDAFVGCASLKTIVIPDGAVEIENAAFWECNSLESIVLPDTIQKIGENAFWKCTSLKSITIPNGVTVIEEGLFYRCSALESVALPASVQIIKESVFSGCSSLKSVNIPNGLTEMTGFMTFYGCSQLTEIFIPPSVEYVDSNLFLTEGKSLTVYGVPGSAAHQAADEFIMFYGNNNFANEMSPVFTFVPLSAQPTSSNVLVNGEQISFDAYNIMGNNYFKLRDLAYILSDTDKCFGVEWDENANAITLTSGVPYSPVGGEMLSGKSGSRTPVPGYSAIILDGKSVSLTAYNIDGYNYFKLRDIGNAFDFGVSWNGATNSIGIDTNQGYSE